MGGGASGLCCLVSLVDQLKASPPPRALTVRLFEKRVKTVGAGLPYQLDQSRSNIMNDSINYISVKGYGEPDHFMRWLAAEKPRWGKLFPEIAQGFDLDKINPGATFLPRIVVGMYLEDCYQ